MALGSFSFVGIGMMAAILPLLYVERGAQMCFVLQSVPAARQRGLLLGRHPAALDAGPLAPVPGDVRPRRCPRGLIDGVPLTELGSDIWPLVIMGVDPHPARLWAFGRAERYAKRTGKLKRVG